MSTQRSIANRAARGPVAARHSCRPVKFGTSSPRSHQPPLEQTNPVVPTTVAVTPCGLVPVYQTARCYSRQYARHHQCNFFSEFANVRACLFVVKTRIPRIVSHIMCATSCSVFECHRLTDTQSCLFSLFCANSVYVSPTVPLRATSTAQHSCLL